MQGAAWTLVGEMVLEGHSGRGEKTEETGEAGEILSYGALVCVLSGLSLFYISSLSLYMYICECLLLIFLLLLPPLQPLLQCLCVC